ncbi:hypothetical protein LWI29_035073 [Acer saccharum]|uniref:Uncharacterized protein n=1 Tax=Acer saccharum TaxID=4024 RepID=A0AA39SMA8_ACESA|nr:hypothetical protein LWI29_035073 [Acer saccharum]
MDAEMETTSSFYDLEDLSIREQFRRYGKRHLTSTVSPNQESSVSKFSEPTSIHNPTNTALILENIKQEVESIGFEGTLGKMQSASKRRSSVDSLGFLEVDVGSKLLVGEYHHLIKERLLQRGCASVFGVRCSVVESDGLGTHDINDGDLTFLALLWQLSSKEFILFKRGYVMCKMELQEESISLLWCLVHLEDQ